MSLDFAKKKSQTTQETTSQSDPWDVAVPYLTDFLGRLKTAGADLGTTTATTQAAGEKLIENAAGGNPWESQIKSLADKMFAVQSEAPTASAAYGDYKTRMTPYADGANMDIENNPYIKDMLSRVSGDVQNRVAGHFAGSGRDMSTAHIKAMTQGISDAQLPVLAQLFQDAEGKHIAAAGDMFKAGGSTAELVQGLNKDALGTNAGGVDMAKSALEAKDYGPTRTIETENMLKTMDVEQLGMLAELLYGAGGLGQQSSGTGVSNTKSSGFGANIKLADIGKILAGLG